MDFARKKGFRFLLFTSNKCYAIEALKTKLFSLILSYLTPKIHGVSFKKSYNTNIIAMATLYRFYNFCNFLISCEFNQIIMTPSDDQ